MEKNQAGSLITKRAEYDRCNICGKMEKLTDDHVPPKFWHNSSIKRYSQGLGTYNPEGTQNQFPWKARQGITFKSLCSDCNNRILGSETDRSLQQLCESVKKNMRVGSKHFNCRIKPNRVAQAVAGHMLAAKDYYDDECSIDTELRKYVLNPSQMPPENMSLCYFLYPHNCIVIGRDFVVGKAINMNESYRLPEGTISCIYSYPMGFLLLSDKQKLKLPDLFYYASGDIDEERDILCSRDSQFYPHTQRLRHPLWPIKRMELCLCLLENP